MDPDNAYFNQRVLDLGLDPKQTPLYKKDWLAGLALTGKWERRHIPSAEYWGLMPRREASPGESGLAVEGMTDEQRREHNYSFLFSAKPAFFYDAGYDSDGYNVATVVVGGLKGHSTAIAGLTLGIKRSLEMELIGNYRPEDYQMFAMAQSPSRLDWADVEDACFEVRDTVSGGQHFRGLSVNLSSELRSRIRNSEHTEGELLEGLAASRP
ncbi:MAG: hypothetical protein ABH879_08160 [archaeon]